MVQPLSGLRVIDLSEDVAGPFAARLLADYGAEVVKVEPPGGDRSRRLGPFPDDRPDPERSALFLHLNRNKKSTTLNIRLADDFGRLERLLSGADALICSCAPQEFESLRVAHRAMAANPRIVVTSVTPWGLTGPYRDRYGTEIVFDAFGHAMGAFGMADREPLTGGGELCQYYAGQVAALATLGAILSAGRSGQGQLIDISVAEAQLASADRRSVQLLRYQYTGREFSRARLEDAVVDCSGGYHECADGWVHPEIAGKHQADLRSMMNIDEHADLTAAFEQWVRARTRREISRSARSRDLPIFPVNEFADLLDDPHLAAHDFWVVAEHPVAGSNRYPGPSFRLSRGDGYRQRLPAPLLGQHDKELRADPPAGVMNQAGKRLETGFSSLPLEGVRVLDLTVVWAGPGATMLLAELGAEVIRVESLRHFPVSTRGFHIRPPGDDPSALGQYRGNYADLDPGDRPWNRFGGFNGLNRGKLSMTADLRRPEGVEIFKRLATVSDVVVDNYSAGVTEKLGIDYQALADVNPRIICLAMPMFGRDGPYRAVGGMGGIADAWSGLMASRGYPDASMRYATHTPHMDGTSGPAAALAVLCALRHRELTGEGQFVELAQAENLLQQVGENLLDSQWNSRRSRPLGNRDRWSGIQGCYPCIDPQKWVVLTARGDETWERLVRTLGFTDWIGDQRFATAALRLHHHDEIDRRIAGWTSRRSSEEVASCLQAARIPAGPVMSEAAAYTDVHLREREFFVEVNHPECGTHRYPGRPWKSSRWPGPNRAPAPCLGEHNDYVYRDILGVDDAEFARLKASGHIGSEYSI